MSVSRENDDSSKIVSFIKLVEKMKKIKLDHRKDIKDLMKDIYREVK